MKITIFFYIFLVTAFVSFFVSFLAWKRKRVNGAIVLSRLMFSAGLYAFFIAFEAVSTTLAGKIFWSKIAYIGAVSVPVLYFMYIMCYTGKNKVTSLRNTLLLFTLPFITLILAFTNEKHHLIWTGFSPITPETNLMKYQHGIWFWIGYMAFDYVLLFVATISLVRFVLFQQNAFRLQGWIVFIAGICPWVAGIVYLTNSNPVSGFDIAPVTTGISGVLLIYVILKANFLDLIPIARETLFETLEDGIIALDAKNRVQDINESACLYLSLSDKSILGLPLESSIASYSPLVNAVISPDSFDQFEIDTPLGAKILKISKQPIKNISGSRLVVIRDISDQIAKQKEILAGEGRYRTMYNLFRMMADNMSDMLWAKDLNKNFIFVNKAMCDNLLKATDTDEPIGKSDLFFKEREQQKHPEHPDWHNIDVTCQETDEKILQSGKPEHFDEFGNVSGEFIFMDVRKAPILDEHGEMIGVVGSARDVTLQKRIEMDIYKRDKLLNAITKATDLLIQGEDIDENIHGCLEIIGKATEVNRICIFKCVYDVDTRKPDQNLVYEWTDGIILTQNPYRNLSSLNLQSFDWYDKLFHAKVCMGKTVDFNQLERTFLESQNIKSILIAPVFIDKVFWGFISFADCLFEREWTSTEERLLTSAAASIGSVYARKKNQIELMEAKEKAEESDRLKSAFLANMSHEIRTPMNSVLGFISLLQEPDLTSEEKTEYINIVKKGAERLLNTIHDIIDISKIEARQISVDLLTVDLNEMMTYFYNLFSPEAETKGLLFNPPEIIPQEVAFIRTDRNKIYDIMTNLIRNALKYTTNGYLEIGCVRHSASVLFYVRDTGIGVSEEKRQTIFERFVQADVSNTRTYEGAGLGLSISKAYVEMLGGKIWVESEVNKGSTFYFKIPVSDQSMKSGISVPVASDGLLPEKAPLNILIVEDDQANFEYVNVILKKENHRVRHTITGIEAVELCRKHADVDLILMDIKLPDIDGYETARRIRTLNKEIPIIVVSAYAFQDEREKALAAGCNDYVTKPVKREVLLAAIGRFRKTDPF